MHTIWIRGSIILPIFKGIIFFDVLPSHDCGNELMFLNDGVGVYKSKVSDTGNTREIWTWN
jgi:hypothetical protein